MQPKAQRFALLALTLLATAILAGCASPNDEVRFAYVTKDTQFEPSKDPERLAAFLSEQLDQPVTIQLFQTNSAALEALRFGQVDMVSSDGAAAWLAWSKFDVPAIVAELRSDRGTTYGAAAWVTDAETFPTMESLIGKGASCHTGATKSAGMFMPMGWLISQDLVDPSGYDDVSEIQDLARDTFPGAVVPAEGNPFYDYKGALRCLSEGAGDVAFIRDSSPADYCGDDEADWCLDLEDYTMIQEFARVPTHPIMANPNVDEATLDRWTQALLALNDSEAGQTILSEVFGASHGLTAVDAESHLGSYGAALAGLPGIEDYASNR